MKKPILIFAVFLAAFSAFAQSFPTVGVLPFEPEGSGVSSADAAAVSQLLLSELGNSATLTILPEQQAQDAQYIIRGQVSRRNNQIALTATIHEASSGRLLNTARAQGANLNAISMFQFCAQLADFIPFPNYLLGRWESTVQMPDGPVTAVLEFRTGRVVVVEKYETWEHHGTDSLKYQAVGTGTYTFVGHHLRRFVTAGGQRVLTHAALNINLPLEDALADFTTINENGLMLLFDDSRGSFQLVNRGLPFGNNLTGPSVYPEAHVFYREFTRLR